MMWRDTSSPIRAAGCDSRILVALSLWLFHMAWWTFYCSVTGMAVFAALEYYGLSVPAALRTVRRWLAGRDRPAVPHWKRRRFA